MHDVFMRARIMSACKFECSLIKHGNLMCLAHTTSMHDELWLVPNEVEKVYASSMQHEGTKEDLDTMGSVSERSDWMISKARAG